ENFAIELGLQKEKPDCSEKNNQLLLEKDEALVYSCVDLRPKSLSQLLEETGMQPAVLADVLMGLSGRGLVKEYFKNCYIRNV
ncbi:MAG: DNA-protecting protein DprA, partial [Roseburia sp.]